jgi:hypothetical protein
VIGQDGAVYITGEDAGRNIVTAYFGNTAWVVSDTPTTAMMIWAGITIGGEAAMVSYVTGGLLAPVMANMVGGALGGTILASAAGAVAGNIYSQGLNSLIYHQGFNFAALGESVVFGAIAGAAQGYFFGETPNGGASGEYGPNTQIASLDSVPGFSNGDPYFKYALGYGLLGGGVGFVASSFFGQNSGDLEGPLAGAGFWLGMVYGGATYDGPQVPPYGVA